MTRDVDAVPALAQQQELPAGGVRNLDDQAAVRAQQLMRGVKIAGRVIEMFEDVKHRDGGATRGIIQNGKLAAWYASAWQQLPGTQRPRTYILAVGDDANLPLFRLLAHQDGVLEQVLSTEPMEFKRIHVKGIENVDLNHEIQEDSKAAFARIIAG